MASDSTVTVDIDFVGGNTVVSPYDPPGVDQQVGQCLEMARFIPRHNQTNNSSSSSGNGGVVEGSWGDQEEPPGMVLWACVSVYVGELERSAILWSWFRGRCRRPPPPALPHSHYIQYLNQKRPSSVVTPYACCASGLQARVR